MAREVERKCDTCRHNMSDYRGTYCGCIQNSEYGLYSIYGWCEHYQSDLKCDRIDKNSKRKQFFIQDMNFTFNKPISVDEMEILFLDVLKSIGAVSVNGHLN